MLMKKYEYIVFQLSCYHAMFTPSPSTSVFFTCFLDFNGTLHRFGGKRKTDQHAVAHLFDECTVELADQFVMYILIFPEDFKSFVFIRTHQRCIPDDVGKHDGG